MIKYFLLLFIIILISCEQIEQNEEPWEYDYDTEVLNNFNKISCDDKIIAIYIEDSDIFALAKNELLNENPFLIYKLNEENNSWDIAVQRSFESVFNIANRGKIRIMKDDNSNFYVFLKRSWSNKRDETWSDSTFAIAYINNEDKWVNIDRPLKPNNEPVRMLIDCIVNNLGQILLVAVDENGKYGLYLKESINSEWQKTQVLSFNSIFQMLDEQLLVLTYEKSYISKDMSKTLTDVTNIKKFSHALPILPTIKKCLNGSYLYCPHDHDWTGSYFYFSDDAFTWDETKIMSLSLRGNNNDYSLNDFIELDNSGTIYFAIDELLSSYPADKRSGIYYSNDFGESWEMLLFADFYYSCIIETTSNGRLLYKGREGWHLSKKALWEYK